MSIRFFKDQGELGFLSNFYKHPFEMDGTEYSTSEHAYHALKYMYPDAPEENKKLVSCIRRADTPYKAKIWASTTRPTRNWKWQQDIFDTRTVISPVIDPNWEQRKLDTMLRVLTHKFKDEQMAALLKQTGDKKLYEASPYDDFWGVGKDGTGANNLGKLLEHVRSHLS